MAFPFAQNNEVLEIILDGLADGILVVDGSMRIVFANKVVSRLFNLKRDAVGRDVVEVVIDHRICEVIRRCSESGEAIQQEFHITINRRDNNRQSVLSVDAEPVAGDLKERYVRVILRDVTHRVETEQVRRDFVANASHELRTPLSIINGYIENLSDGALENKELAQRFLGIMKKHGDRIARIVEDMLTISKFESANQDPTRAGIFDLQSCVTDVIERLQPLIEEKSATVSMIPAGPEAPIAGDRFYWDQIFFNLIENALKQNLCSGLNIRVTLVDQGSRYEISIADDGVGIPSTDLPFIFKRFYRVEKHHSKEIKGTGLGLSIVKRAVEAHGGEVTARSEPGKETAFVISVPKGDLTQDADTDANDADGETNQPAEFSTV